MKAKDVVLVTYELFGDPVEYLIEIELIVNGDLSGTVLKDSQGFTVGRNICMRIDNIISIVPAERPAPVPEDGMKVLTSAADTLTRINGVWYRSSMHDDESVLYALKSNTFEIIE